MSELMIGSAAVWTGAKDAVRPQTADDPPVPSYATPDANVWTPFAVGLIGDAVRVRLSRDFGVFREAGELLPSELYPKTLDGQVVMRIHDLSVDTIKTLLSVPAGSVNELEFDADSRAVEAPVALLIRGQSPINRDAGKLFEAYFPAAHAVSMVEVSVGTDEPASVEVTFGRSRRRKRSASASRHSMDIQAAVVRADSISPGWHADRYLPGLARSVRSGPARRVAGR